MEETSTLKTVNLWQTVIIAFISLIISVISVGVYTGSMQQRILTLEESKTNIEHKLDLIQSKMVEKDDLREIKDDLKELRRVSRK